jgi:5-(carboxyamino)imidazole ribonucleotide synthase
MKIGIIGGGQLGMMMAEEAKKLNHSIVSLDPNRNSSILLYTDCHISKQYDDEEVLQYMSETCDVITYEFENVNYMKLSKYGNMIPQGTEALKISSNRILEKEFAKSLEINVPKFVQVKSLKDIFTPCIIKTSTGGYDGKGQIKITSKEQIDRIENIDKINYICEEFINFDYEISVIATRDKYGNVVFYPIPINKHKKGILFVSIVDGKIPEKVQEQAINFTKKIIEKLDYVGTLAVEYFVKDNTVIFNEFAPRPHNSGHYSLDGCDVSQFKNHILAITGQKVIAPKLKHTTIMINVLGQNKRYYDKARMFENVKIYDYNKRSTLKNRKIGHINIIDKQDEKAINLIASIIKE